MKSIAIVLLFVFHEMCQWTNPKELTNISIYIQQALPSIKENVQHLVGTYEGKVYYIQVNDMNSSNTQIMNVKDTILSKVSIAGSENNLYIIALGTYGANQTGFFFSESTTNGKNWKPLTMISPQDTNIRDKKFSLLFNETTGRLFLFLSYHKQKAPSSILLMSLPKGSSTWSQEKSIYVLDNITSVNGVGIENTLLVTWVLNNYTYFSKSKDNGASWSIPQKLMPGSHQQLVNTDSALFNLYKDKERPLVMRYSVDNGNKWSNKTELLELPIWDHNPSVSLCNTFGGYQKLLVSMVNYGDYGVMQMVIIDSFTRYIQKVMLPFRYEYGPLSLVVGCGQNTDMYTLDIYVFVQFSSKISYAKRTFETLSK